ncbi:hypothetical protein [Paenibacillus antibioticophila]|nr:hypothetical protein [Paenibacillus antibioticophila]
MYKLYLSLCPWLGLHAHRCPDAVTPVAAAGMKTAAYQNQI